MTGRRLANPETLDILPALQGGEDVKTNPLHINISPKVNCDGFHIIRWCETRHWGRMTYMITVARPDELERTRRDFDLFLLVPDEKRRAAADAARMTMTPAAEILAAFVPKQEEKAHIQRQQ